MNLLKEICHKICGLLAMVGVNVETALSIHNDLSRA